MKKNILLPLVIASILSCNAFAVDKTEGVEMDYDKLSLQNDLWSKRSEVEIQKKTALTSKLENLNLQREISAFEESYSGGTNTGKKIELVKIYKDDNLGEKLALEAGDIDINSAIAQQNIISDNSTISLSSEDNNYPSEKEKEYEKRLKLLEKQQAQFLDKMQSMVENLADNNAEEGLISQGEDSVSQGVVSKPNKNTLKGLSDSTGGSGEMFDFSDIAIGGDERDIRLSGKLMSVRPTSKTIYIKAYDQDSSDSSYYKVELKNDQKEVDVNLDDNTNLSLQVVKNEARLVRLRYKETEFTIK